MNQLLAFGSFILALGAIITGIWGALASDPHMYMAAVILALGFFVVGLHAAEKNSKEHRK